MHDEKHISFANLNYEANESLRETRKQNISCSSEKSIILKN